jgi:flavodoxin
VIAERKLPMAKTLVTYYSRTGNTRMVAETIAGALSGDTDLKPIKDATEVSGYGLVFVGFPVQSHSVPYPVEVFLKTIPEGKKTALFSTHGSVTGGRLSREAIEHATVIASKAKIIATFSCRGKVSVEALEVLMKSPEHEAWGDMAASAATHPDEHDLAEARAFAKWVVTLGAHGHYKGL